MQKFTTFENETVLYRRGKLALVQVDDGRANNAGKRMYVVSDRVRTDYPMFYEHDGQVRWDNPEYWPKAFRDAVGNVIKGRENQ